MKKAYSILVFVGLFLLLTGCAGEKEDRQENPVRTEELRAGIVTTQSRAQIGAYGQLAWEKGDIIAVHRQTSGYENCPLTEGGVFNVHLFDSERRDGFAVYPADIADGTAASDDDFKVILPSFYRIPRDGMTDKSPVPMVAVNDPEAEDLFFRHLGGLLRLSLDNVPVETAFLKINLGKRITGSFAVAGVETSSPSIATDSGEAGDLCFELELPLTSVRDDYVLNIPVPTGTYSSISVKASDFRDNLLSVGSCAVDLPFGRTDGYLVDLSLSPLDVRNLPLCLKAVRPGTVTISNPLGKTLEISRDLENWESVNARTITIDLNWSECVFLRGNNETYASGTSSYTTINSNMDCYAYGNIMSLLDAENFSSAEEITGTYAFYRLFYNNKYLKKHPGLDLLMPAMTVSAHAYREMFYGCSTLTCSPALPAMNLAQRCYDGMFYGCSKLTVPPSILPATELKEYCYYSMFENCSSLTATPVLPADKMATSCYFEMFRGCSALKKAPALPGTQLAPSCYSYMFYSCQVLVEAPDVLPANTLAPQCYSSMFAQCRSLEVAPALPAVNLASHCYDNMFYACPKLVTVPSSLPATVLAESCYEAMFDSCTALQTAPALPATSLAHRCYYQMFKGCSSLNYVKALFVTEPALDYTYNWLSGVKSTGTFVKNAAATWNVTGPNGIPSGWTVTTATN